MMVPDEARQALLTLYHDVGKYVARTARNLPALAERDSVAPALLGLLVADLYALREGMRASQVFAERAAALRRFASLDAGLDAVATLLCEVDLLEPQLRAGEIAAVWRGAAIALEVEARLRELLPNRRAP